MKVYVVGVPSDIAAIYSTREAALEHSRAEDWMWVWEVTVHDSFPPSDDAGDSCIRQPRR